jgi:excinuclease UvrABC ATPase subunit
VEKPKEGVVYNVWFEGVLETVQRRSLAHEASEGPLTRHGLEFYKAERCTACGGSRINARARKVRVNGKTIPELVEMELTDLQRWLSTVHGPLADPIVRRMSEVLQNLIDIGVGYLSLNRGVGTLSGGESQRVKMARQLGCDLVDLTYIFDEPSVGLHQRDIAQLISTIKRIKEKGNTVLVVEHDPAVMREADWIIDLGPGAGRQGGEIVFTGTYQDLLKSDTLTGRLLTKRSTSKDSQRKPRDWIHVRNASVHNLKNITVKIPQGVLVCITGVAGSGKSSLILDVFARDHPDAIVVDQSPVGRSSRSNPATYVGVFDLIRDEFGHATGKRPSYFSFNSRGACAKCKGTGELKVEMHFLEPVTMVCDECNGRRYRAEVLQFRYKGKSIYDVLRMTVGEAIDFFENSETKRRLALLRDVGLDYLELGQTVSSLSGGEAQRIKLAKELHKKGKIYILDEPTTGLHLADIAKLLEIANRLVDAGNTVIVIEHNLDVVRNADWIIDMGPEGGSRGGEILAQGIPQEIAKDERSYTGQYLAKELTL